MFLLPLANKVSGWGYIVITVSAPLSTVERILTQSSSFISKDAIIVKMKLMHCKTFAAVKQIVESIVNSVFKK